MKKLITIITLVMALCLMSVTAFAGELDQTAPSGDSTVFYKIGEFGDINNPDDPTDDEVSGTYKVTIPDYIEAVPMNKTPVTQNITAKEVLIPYNTTLSVDITYDSELKLKENNDVTIGYGLQVNGADINTGDTILTVDAGNPTGVTTVAIGGILTEAPIYSGMYANTANFVVSVA